MNNTIYIQTFIQNYILKINKEERERENRLIKNYKSAK